VETEHLVDITPTDRADGRFAAACSCGEHAESRSAALLDAWVAFHLARDTTSRVTTTPRDHAGGLWVCQDLHKAFAEYH